LRLVGQHQPTREPSEELHPEQLLERADLMADRGLGDVQLGGGAREAEMSGGGLESAQCCERRQTAGHGYPLA
jgi:hypothetical protein